MIKYLIKMVSVLLIVLSVFNSCEIHNNLKGEIKEKSKYDEIIIRISKEIENNRYKIHNITDEIDFVEKYLNCRLKSFDEEHNFDLVYYSYDDVLSFSLTSIPVVKIAFYINGEYYSSQEYT